jgi:tetratricopeptide (TPR) repeat protein
LAQIFLSYSREDLERVGPLVEALENEGYTVWWDRALNPGENFETTIDHEIQQAGCVVALWTEYSVQSQWVRNEAMEGMDRGVLVPAQLDDVRIPVAFKQVQTADFRDWPQSIETEEYRKFIKVIQATLNPDQQPTEPSLNGLGDMRPHGKRRRRRKRERIIPALVLALVVAASVATYQTWRNSQVPVPSHEKPVEALTESKAAYRNYQRGTDLLRRGQKHNIDEAIGQFEAATRADPGFAVAYAAMCRAHIESYQLSYATDDVDLARTSCGKARELDPDHSLVQLALAELSETGGELDAAREHYKRSLSLDPSNADATGGLAQVYYQQGEYQLAEEMFIEATRLKPAFWKVHNDLGTFYLRQGLYFQAMESYLRVTQLTSTNATAHNNLGAARFYAGDFEGAYEAWKTANNLATEPASYSNMGTALYYLRRFEEAHQQFEVAARMSPDDHRLWGNMGDSLRFMADSQGSADAAYRRAIALVTKMLEVNADDVSANSRLGVYYAAVGEIDRAREHMRRAESGGGDDLDVLYDLAVAASLLKEVTEQKEYVSRALDAGYPVVLYESDPQFN